MFHPFLNCLGWHLLRLILVHSWLFRWRWKCHKPDLPGQSHTNMYGWEIDPKHIFKQRGKETECAKHHTGNFLDSGGTGVSLSFFKRAMRLSRSATLFETGDGSSCSFSGMFVSPPPSTSSTSITCFKFSILACNSSSLEATGTPSLSS